MMAEPASSGDLTQRLSACAGYLHGLSLSFLRRMSRRSEPEREDADTQHPGRRDLLRGARERLSADGLRAGWAALGARLLAAQPVEPIGSCRMDGSDGRIGQEIPGRRDGPAQC